MEKLCSLHDEKANDVVYLLYFISDNLFEMSIRAIMKFGGRPGIEYFLKRISEARITCGDVDGVVSHNVSCIFDRNDDYSSFKEYWEQYGHHVIDLNHFQEHVEEIDVYPSKFMRLIGM